MKLKGKFIWIFSLFALIPVILTGVIVFSITQSSSVKEAKASLEQQQKSAMTSIKENISLIIKNTQTIANMPIIDNYLGSIEKGKENLILKSELVNKLKESKDNVGLYEDVILLDKSGLGKCSILGNLDGQNLSDLDYFKKISETKKIQISRVKKSLSTGKPIFVVAIPIIDSNSNFKGALIAPISLDSISKIINQVKIGDTGYIFIVENDGTSIAHKNPKEILQKNLLKISIGENILKNKEGVDEYTYLGVKKLIAYSTDEELGWTYIATIPRSELIKTANLVLKVITTILLLTIAVCITISVLISKGISKPIINVSEAMNRISKGDFMISINSSRNDEIGEMTCRLNETLDSLRTSIRGVKDTSKVVGDSAETLNYTAVQMTTAANEVASAIQEVAEGSTEQANEIMEVVNLLNNFTEQLGIVEDKLKNVSNKANSTQSKAEEGKEEIDNLVNSISKIQISFDLVVSKVTGLSNTVSKIGNITDVINGVSEQTNLLALNAAIEAARAGEQGKGFAVVADEIRKLAEESQKSSEEILSLVKSISIETEGVIDTTTNVKELILQQESIANRTIDSFENIISSVVEVAPLMDETNTSLKNVNDSKLEVIEKVQNVSAFSEEVSASCQQISASSEEMLASCEEVAELAVKVDNASEELVNKVEIFKVE